MSEQEFQALINGKDIWLSCSFMVAIILIQSIIFLRNAVQEAHRLDIAPRRIHSAMRAACITSVGPSLSPVIIAMSMIALVGAPNAWFNLNNIGAARTELANISIGAGIAGVDVLSSNMGITAWEYALWTCALNGTGWLVVTFLLTHRMESITNTLYAKFDKKLVSTLMGAAVTSLFAYLLSNNLVGKNSYYWAAAAISAACMAFFGKFCAKSEILQELSLGLSMLAGMFAATLLAGV